MTNGSVEVTQNFLQRHGLSSFVAEAMEVAEVGLWKPRPEVYQYAAERLGLQPHQVPTHVPLA
jgi:FMN phosphatase YigB (HAD superfamily)